MASIAFITTCKGRLHHLQETLPLIVAQEPAEIIVVDYGCPQKSGQWVKENYPTVNVVNVEDDPGFCVARARNIGAQHSTSQWLCFIDADIKVSKGWVDWMHRILDPRFFYRASKKDGTRDKETWGTCVCERKAFEFIEGYDEVFNGWGGEDDDLYARLELIGLAEFHYPHQYVSAISHPETERVLYHQIKNRRTQAIVNKLYSAAKHQILFLAGRGKRVPLETRQALMKECTKNVLAWAEKPDSPLPKITLQTAEIGWMPDPFKVLKEMTLTLTVQSNEKAAPKK